MRRLFSVKVSRRIWSVPRPLRNRRNQPRHVLFAVSFHKHLMRFRCVLLQKETITSMFSGAKFDMFNANKKLFECAEPTNLHTAAIATSHCCLLSMMRDTNWYTWYDLTTSLDARQCIFHSTDGVQVDAFCFVFVCQFIQMFLFCHTNDLES